MNCNSCNIEIKRNTTKLQIVTLVIDNVDGNDDIVMNLCKSCGRKALDAIADVIE